MILYHYKCQHCLAEMYEHQSIKDRPLQFCTVCGTDNLQRIIHNPYCIIQEEAKTLGLLAERNTQQKSQSERSELYEQQELNKALAKKVAREELQAKLPPGASLPDDKPVDKAWKTDLSLVNLPPHKIEKYVMTGQK